MLVPPLPMPTFKFDSKSCFLTYSQSGDLTIPEVYDHLNGIKPVLWARICIEQHVEQGQHIHVVAEWRERHQSRQPNFLDVRGHHPNIQRIRSKSKALEYVSKDGQFIDYGTVPAGSAKDRNWVELAEGSSKIEFMSEAFREGLSQNWAKEFWELGSAKHAECIPDDYEGDPNREDVRLREETLPENICAVLVGPTGCGKSSWAKRVCPKPALWVTHMDALRQYRAGYHKSIVMDDMVFKHLPVQSQIHLTDWWDGRQIHCRYGYATIPAQTVKIFTCNEYPFVEHPAIERRIKLINLY